MKLFLSILLLLNCLTVSAAPLYQYSEDSLQKLYSELHYLREVGLEIHQKYNNTKKDLDQLKSCKSEYGYISTRAKATIGIANRLDSPNKQEYIDTGWHAYECIRCTGNVKSCDVIPPTLETIKQEFKQLKTQQQ